MFFDGASGDLLPSPIFDGKVTSNHKKPACVGLKLPSQVNGLVQIQLDNHSGHVGRRLGQRIACPGYSAKHHRNLRCDDIAVFHGEPQCWSAHHDHNVGLRPGIFFLEEIGRALFMFRVRNTHQVEEFGIDCNLFRRAFAQPLLQAVDDLGGRRKCVVIRTQNEHTSRSISCVNLGSHE